MPLGQGSALRCTALHDAKEIRAIFKATSPERPPHNFDELPCMGIPGNSHETAIFELEFQLEFRRCQRREFPPREFQGPAVQYSSTVQYRKQKDRSVSAGLSLVQFRELLGNRRINELSLRFRVGSLTFCGGTFSSVPFDKK